MVDEAGKELEAGRSNGEKPCVPYSEVSMLTLLVGERGVDVEKQCKRKVTWLECWLVRFDRVILTNYSNSSMHDKLEKRCRGSQL